MSFINWIVNLPLRFKLPLALLVGISFYAMLRYFAHLANVEAKKMGITREDKKYYSEKKKLDRLIAMSKE
jgi:hypothetical protein